MLAQRTPLRPGSPGDAPMMWFFAILIVLALGGVAAVAAGRGTPMATVHPDRVDVEVPTGRALTGTDVRRIRFGTAVRGYRMDEVDALLTRVARQLDEPAPAGGESSPQRSAEARSTEFDGVVEGDVTGGVDGGVDGGGDRE